MNTKYVNSILTLNFQKGEYFKKGRKQKKIDMKESRKKKK